MRTYCRAAYARRNVGGLTKMSVFSRAKVIIVSIVEVIAALLMSGLHPSTSVVLSSSTDTPVAVAKSRVEAEVGGVGRATLVGRKTAMPGSPPSYRAAPTIANLAYFAMPVIAPTSTSSGGTSPSSPPTPSTSSVTIPAGTVVTVCLIDSVGPRSYPGQLFRASIGRDSGSASDVFVPLQAEALLQLVTDGIGSSDPQMQPHLQLVAMQIHGRFFEVTATPISGDGSAGVTGRPVGSQRRAAKSMKEIGYGVAIGAASGGAIGGWPGAGIGAAAGGGIAAVRSILARGHPQARIPSEARLSFTLAKDLLFGPIDEAPRNAR